MSSPSAAAATAEAAATLRAWGGSAPVRRSMSGFAAAGAALGVGLGALSAIWVRWFPFGGSRSVKRQRARAARARARCLAYALGRLAVRTAAAAAATARLGAVAAVNRLVAAGWERNGGVAAALAAFHFEHFARGTVAAVAAAAAARAVARTAAAAAGSTLRLTRRAAIHAAVGLIGKALRGEKLLFAGAEREGCAAINAIEGFIGIHVLGSSIFGRK